MRRKRELQGARSMPLPPRAAGSSLGPWLAGPKTMLPASTWWLAGGIHPACKSCMQLIAGAECALGLPKTAGLAGVAGLWEPLVAGAGAAGGGLQSPGAAIGHAPLPTQRCCACCGRCCRLWRCATPGCGSALTYSGWMMSWSGRMGTQVGWAFLCAFIGLWVGCVCDLGGGLQRSEC